MCCRYGKSIHCQSRCQYDNLSPLCHTLCVIALLHWFARRSRTASEFEMKVSQSNSSAQWNPAMAAMRSCGCVNNLNFHQDDKHHSQQQVSLKQSDFLDEPDFVANGFISEFTMAAGDCRERAQVKLPVALLPQTHSRLEVVRTRRLSFGGTGQQSDFSFLPAPQALHISGRSNPREYECAHPGSVFK